MVRLLPPPAYTLMMSLIVLVRLSSEKRIQHVGVDLKMRDMTNDDKCGSCYKLRIKHVVRPSLGRSKAFARSFVRQVTHLVQWHGMPMCSTSLEALAEPFFTRSMNTRSSFMYSFTT